MRDLTVMRQKGDELPKMSYKRALAAVFINYVIFWSIVYARHLAWPDSQIGDANAPYIAMVGCFLQVGLLYGLVRLLHAKISVFRAFFATLLGLFLAGIVLVPVSSLSAPGATLAHADVLLQVLYSAYLLLAVLMTAFFVKRWAYVSQSSSSSSASSQSS